MSLTKELLRTLHGVVQATTAPQHTADIASRQVSSLGIPHPRTESKPLKVWLDAITVEAGQEDESALHVTKLTVCLTYMRLRCQSAAPKDSLSADELDTIWDIFRAALLSPLYADRRAVRSHQGFLSVPLCDLHKPNGDNEEYWRVHLWLPNRPQPDPDFIIHSHKSYGQSWILAGEGTDGEYEVEPVQDIELATHAIYALTDARTITHRDLRMTIVNTEKYLKVKHAEYETHTRDTSYIVPAAAFHTSQIPMDKVHATIFLFDASRGFDSAGGVSLGPKNLTTVEQNRDPGGYMATALVSVVDAVRSWEKAFETAMSLAQDGDWTQAKAVIEKMVTTWKPMPDATPGTELTSSANDVKSLNRYLDLANALLSWVEAAGRKDIEVARTACH